MCVTDGKKRRLISGKSTHFVSRELIKGARRKGQSVALCDGIAVAAQLLFDFSVLLNTISGEKYNHDLMTEALQTHSVCNHNETFDI